MKIDISNDVYQVNGTVAKAEEQRYTSTTVSGGGSTTTVTNGVAHTTHTPVTSTVHHHHDQKIWLIDEDGAESIFSFYNQDVDAREGHEIRLIVSKNSDNIQRYINNSTGRYWRIRGYAPPTKMAGRMMAGFFDHIRTFFYALFMSLPILNIVVAFGMATSTKKKNEFVYPHTRTYLHRLLFVTLTVFMMAAAYLYFDPSKRHLAPELSLTVSPETQVTFTRTIAGIAQPYFKMGDPLGLYADPREVVNIEKDITRMLARSDEETIAAEGLKTESIGLLNPNDESSYVTSYLLLSFIGFFVLYAYNRKQQKIDYQINTQLESMC